MIIRTDRKNHKVQIHQGTWALVLAHFLITRRKVTSQVTVIITDMKKHC